jgi:hypothetical protein
MEQITLASLKGKNFKVLTDCMAEVSAVAEHATKSGWKTNESSLRGVYLLGSQPRFDFFQDLSFTDYCHPMGRMDQLVFTAKEFLNLQ